MGRLIFLDIDGTLTPAGTNVPPESAIRAMDAARANGHKLFLCTGRNYGMLRPLLTYPFDGFVASSGGYVRVGEDVLYDCPMSEELLHRALEIFHANHVFCTIEGRDGSFGDSNLREFLEQTGGGNSELERWRKAITENLGIRDMEDYDGQPIYKIVLMARAFDAFETCRPLLEPELHFVLQDLPAHGCVNGEVNPSAFDKGRGVKLIAEHFQVPLSETIGYGDSINDLEMIEVVGHSVCMENGSPTIQALADEVCPAVTEDGIYHSFVKLGLI